MTRLTFAIELDGYYVNESEKCRRNGKYSDILFFLIMVCTIWTKVSFLIYIIDLPQLEHVTRQVKMYRQRKIKKTFYIFLRDHMAIFSWQSEQLTCSNFDSLISLQNAPKVIYKRKR